MSDLEHLLHGGEVPETIDHNFENDLQGELDEILNCDDESEEEEDFVTGDASNLFQNDLDNVEQDMPITNPDLAALCIHGGRNVLHLTSEEQKIIKQCKDPKLQACLIQNRLKMQQLRYLHTKLTAILNKEKRQLHEMQSQPDSNENVALPKTLIWKLGMPYFKDQQGYGAPPNADCMRKVQNKEYTITEFNQGRRWTDHHQEILLNCIQTSYYKYCESQLEQQINNIEWQIKKADGDVRKRDLQSQLDDFQKQLEALQKEKPRKTPPYGSDVGIDWLLIADTELNGDHTVQECKAMWNIYLHPHINKQDWSEEENEQIKQLATKYRYQDWDSLARELGTNRSGYLVCLHYHTKLCDKFKQKRFSPSEDESLLEIVESCRMGSYIPWMRVASYFEGRSTQQLYHRYRYYLSCKDNTKGMFTEAEDILLVHLVQRLGKNFVKVSKCMGNRTSTQLRNRYNSYLSHLTINVGNFTCLDDKKILEHVQVHGESWNELGQALSRTRSHVRQRYMTLKKYMDKDPSMKVEDVPRRKQPHISQLQAERQTRMAAVLKKLRNSREPASLSAVEALLKQEKKQNAPQKRWEIRNKRVTDTVNDYRLVKYLQGSCLLPLEPEMPGDNLPANETAQSVKILLELLGVELNEFIKKVTVEDDAASFLTDHEFEVIKTLKVSLSDAPTPSTCHKPRLTALVPPNWTTLVGARMLMLKFDLYKKPTGQSLTSLCSSKTEDESVWRLEENVLKLGDDTRARVINERKLFTTRFKVLFKWAFLLSMQFPESLKESTQGVSSNIVTESPKKGRPAKRTYPKVLRMLEAKKQKVDNPPTRQQQAPKTSKYAVSYLPKRAKNKKGPKKILNKARTEPDHGSIKVINIADLKFPSHVPLIDSNVLAKLVKASNNKIVILKQVPANAVQKEGNAVKMCKLPDLCDVNNQAQASTSKSVQKIKKSQAEKHHENLKAAKQGGTSE